jgi:glutathione S-transferase
MPDLTIYFTLFSQPSRTVLTFCKLSSISFTPHAINYPANEFLSEEFTQISPHQLFPALKHNTFTLWESAALVPYLADAFDVDNQWYPKDIKVRGRINAYLHWHHTATRKPLSGFLYARVFAPMEKGTAWTQREEEEHRASVDEWFETIKWQLKETGYVARTQKATVADVFAYNELVNVARFVEMDTHPEVKGWFEKIGGISEVREITDQFMEIAAEIFQ